MTPIRVLVIDDSVVVRKLLADIVASDPALENAGTAPTASIGLQKIAQVVPDIVILDVEMPGMDGIEAVKRLRETSPRLPVIMCSSVTERGADVTLRALAAGASDYLAKPSASTPDGLATFRAELVSKIKALAVARRTVFPPAASPRSATARKLDVAVDVLAIGCSTGGPNALATLFEGFPAHLPVPIVIVQHMPPLFTRMLADRLTASSRVPTFEATDGMLIEAGKAYIAPGGRHMTLTRDGTSVRAALNDDPPENSCRPAVDVLFRSVARVYGSGVLATVMTGMGYDGTRGAGHIVAAGGIVMVQDAPSCVVPSMPTSVADAGHASGVYPLNELANVLVGRIRRHRPISGAYGFVLGEQVR